MVELNLLKIFTKKYQAVSTIRTDIKDKKFIVFVGPSGCGKSPL